MWVSFNYQFAGMKQPKTSKDIPWHQTHEKLHSNAPPWHTVASNQTSQVWAGLLASFDHGHKSLRICCWHPKARGQMIHRWCVADTSVLWDRAFLELCRWCCNKHWVCSAGNHFFNRKEGGSCKITFNQFTETFTPTDVQCYVSISHILTVCLLKGSWEPRRFNLFL